MEIELSQDDSTLTLGMASREDAERFFATAREQAGVFAVLPRQLPFLHRLALEAKAPGFACGCEVEVVQVYPQPGGFGTAFQLVDWDAAKEAALEKALEGEAEVSESELSPMWKIKQMNPTERFRLAMKASRVERQILIRESSPQVLLGLLQHPQIETKEVMEIVKSNFATAGIMEQVARNRKWMSHPDLPALIAKSPKTPTPLAIKLLEYLRTPDLQQMAKSQGLREQLRKAALRVYMKRTGQRF